MSGYQAGQWVHIAAVIDVIADEAILYVDGVPSSKSIAMNTIMQGGWDMMIGNDAIASADHSFSGAIDEVQFYNRVLSASEIATIISNGVL